MTLEEKLEALRVEWKKTPGRRKTIEYQAKLIKMAIEKRDGTIRDVKDILGGYED